MQLYSKNKSLRNFPWESYINCNPQLLRWEHDKVICYPNFLILDKQVSTPKYACLCCLLLLQITFCMFFTINGTSQWEYKLQNYMLQKNTYQITHWKELWWLLHHSKRTSKASWALNTSPEKKWKSVNNTSLQQLFRKMRDNNLCQYPSNKPIDITPMIWYDECMLFTYRIIQISLQSNSLIGKLAWRLL